MITNSSSRMINTRGRVVDVNFDEVDMRRAQGWKIVLNNKQDYYFEYDQSIGGHIAPENMEENLEMEDVMPGGFI